MLASVRNRLFFVIAGMALLASLSIGAAYVATEPERLTVRADARLLADMYALSVGLSNAIRDQEAAIDDYLLSPRADTVARYHQAVEAELQLAERMRLEADHYPAIGASLASLMQDTRAWRAAFAEPAIAAIKGGSKTELARIAATVGVDQEPAVRTVAALVSWINDAEASITVRDEHLTWTRAVSGGIGIVLMLLAAIASLLLARRWITHPLGRLLATATDVQAGENVAFVTEREDEIGQLGHALEGMRSALQSDAEHSSILNRFTEATTFAPDDAAVAAAGLEAFRLLVSPDAAVSHVLNRSKDRAVPDAAIGSAIAEVLPLNALSHCPGIVRGSIYVTPDAAAPLSVHCPVYPVDHGTLACVPLAHGDTVGAVHLYWERRHAFGLEQRMSVARVAEHEALAIGNRRLLAALHGMANTDARTGLANTRAFDQRLEDEQAARADDENVAVLMLDLDEFKEFNDRYGHPSGDEALRAFANILRSCLRDEDIAARYGGEEFVVALPGLGEAAVLAVAERIRSRTHATVIALAPGITGRVTVSIGIASAPQQARDRVTLLRLADEALYRAKQAGRNRVVYSGSPGAPAPAVAAHPKLPQRPARKTDQPAA
ncbi:MAG: diguanylate cyclase [Chloroflexota bacterium]